MKKGTTTAKSYSKRPIKVDASSLFNHHKLIQRSLLPSIENLNNESSKPNSHIKPKLVMHNYQSLVNGELRDIYILVAWSKHVVSCQMVVLGRDDTIISNTHGPVVPDLVHCTPISVWSSSVSMNKSNRKDESYEYISCEPRIMIQDKELKERTVSENKNLRVAIILGTNYGRILSVQLEIHVKKEHVENTMEKDASSRYVLVKHAKNVIEPLAAMLTAHKSKRNDDDKFKRFIDTTVVSPLGFKSEGYSYGSVLCISDLYSYHGPLTFRTESNCISSTNMAHGGKEGSNRKTFKAKDVKDRFVWITWEDGTFIRCPQMAFFPRKSSNVPEELYLSQFIFKGFADSKLQNPHRFMVVPLPRSFPSLLSGPFFNQSDDFFEYNDNDNCEEHDEDDESMDLNDRDVEKTAKEVNLSQEEIYEAVICQKDTSFSNLVNESLSPTISFYSTEDHSYFDADSSSHNKKGFRIKEMKDSASDSVRSIMKDTSTIIGATSSLAKGVFGGMIGAMLGRPKKLSDVLDQDHIKSVDSPNVVKEVQEGNDGEIRSSDDDDVEWFLSSLTKPSKCLHFNKAIYDPQRKVTSISVDPLDGRLMACCDNLGRVLLIDLESKQVVRVWKGFREAECKWFQCPYAVDGVLHSVKYLAIHSKQRNVIEIYRMKHGPMVSKVDVKNSSATVIQCAVQIESGEMYVRCFVLNSSHSSKRIGLVKELTIFDEELRTASMKGSSSYGMDGFRTSFSDQNMSVDAASTQLQMLKQLLSSESSFISDNQIVFDAFSAIDALSDISRALDLLALSSHLEDNTKENKSSFHSRLILYAKERLDEAMKDSTSTNPQLNELSCNIDFHKQLVAAYQEIYKFEVRSFSTEIANDSENETSPWVEEAVTWIQTYETVTKENIDTNLMFQLEACLGFSIFAKACIRPDVTKIQRDHDFKLKLFLCDSTRDRKEVLLHIFRPLIIDIFSMKTTNDILCHMGISKDFEQILLYYGEWFMTLPEKDVVLQSKGVWCPALRWLHDIVVEMFHDKVYEEEGDRNEFIVLHPLLKFCADAIDLPRAFLLSSACYNAIAVATKSVEDQTFGIITSEGCLKPWVELLRKLRVCLFCSLRLYGIPLGAFPLTVTNVDKGDVFSIYQWIAHDELQIANNNDEIIQLEHRFWNEQVGFHPSTEAGDFMENIKLLQMSCTEHGTNIRQFDQIIPMPLMAFFKHYHDADACASHRALIQASTWGRSPSILDKLDDARNAVGSITKKCLASIVIQEIWNTHIRPIYRGMMFSFDEIHEVSEEVILPLCESSEWFTKLNAISIAFLDTLYSVIDRTGFNENGELATAIFQPESISCDQYFSEEVWPPLQADHTLIKLFEKYKVQPQFQAIQVHKGVVAALSLGDDWTYLPDCVDNIGNMFLPFSFHEDFEPSVVANERQIEYIERAIDMKAEMIQNDSVKMENLNDIITLGKTWGMLKTEVIVMFLISMYELGKDKLIEGFLDIKANIRLLDLEDFVERLVPIMCVRLQVALYSLKKIKQCRVLLATIDADICEWVKEQAETVEELRPGRICTEDESGQLISLEVTYDSILRLKRMSNNGEDACALRSMCEILLNAAQKVAP